MSTGELYRETVLLASLHPDRIPGAEARAGVVARSLPQAERLRQGMGQELNAQRDPDSECQGLAAESCSQLEQAYQAIETCCCPSGQYCNEETSTWTCTPSCQDASDCASNASATSCCPNDNGSEIVDSDFICKPDDGKAYHGCSGTFTTCSSPYDCWTAPGGQYCTLSCNQDSDCNDPNAACCDTSGPTCSNDFDSCDANTACGGTACAGACLPCGTF